MVAGRLVKDARPVVDAAALGVIGAEGQAANARQGYGGGAHGAGLKGHDKVAIGKTGRTKAGRGFADNQYLGVGRWIA